MVSLGLQALLQEWLPTGRSWPGKNIPLLGADSRGFCGRSELEPEEEAESGCPVPLEATSG